MTPLLLISLISIIILVIACIVAPKEGDIDDYEHDIDYDLPLPKYDITLFKKEDK